MAEYPRPHQPYHHHADRYYEEQQMQHQQQQQYPRQTPLPPPPPVPPVPPVPPPPATHMYPIPHTAPDYNFAPQSYAPPSHAASNGPPSSAPAATAAAAAMYAPVQHPYQRFPPPPASAPPASGVPSVVPPPPQPPQAGFYASSPSYPSSARHVPAPLHLGAASHAASSQAGVGAPQLGSPGLSKMNTLMHDLESTLARFSDESAAAAGAAPNGASVAVGHQAPHPAPTATQWAQTTWQQQHDALHEPSAASASRPVSSASGIINLYASAGPDARWSGVPGGGGGGGEAGVHLHHSNLASPAAADSHVYLPSSPQTHGAPTMATTTTTTRVSPSPQPPWPEMPPAYTPSQSPQLRATSPPVATTPSGGGSRSRRVSRALPPTPSAQQLEAEAERRIWEAAQAGVGCNRAAANATASSRLVGTPLVGSPGESRATPPPPPVPMRPYGGGGGVAGGVGGLDAQTPPSWSPESRGGALPRNRTWATIPTAPSSSSSWHTPSGSTSSSVVGYGDGASSSAATAAAAVSDAKREMAIVGDAAIVPEVEAEQPSVLSQAKALTQASRVMEQAALPSPPLPGVRPPSAASGAFFSSAHAAPSPGHVTVTASSRARPDLARMDSGKSDLLYGVGGVHGGGLAMNAAQASVDRTRSSRSNSTASSSTGGGGGLANPPVPPPPWLGSAPHDSDHPSSRRGSPVQQQRSAHNTGSLGSLRQLRKTLPTPPPPPPPSHMAPGDEAALAAAMAAAGATLYDRSTRSPPPQQHHQQAYIQGSTVPRRVQSPSIYDANRTPPPSLPRSPPPPTSTLAGRPSLVSRSSDASLPPQARTSSPRASGDGPRTVSSHYHSRAGGPSGSGGAPGSSSQGHGFGHGHAVASAAAHAHAHASSRNASISSQSLLSPVASPALLPRTSDAHLRGAAAAAGASQMDQAMRRQPSLGQSVGASGSSQAPRASSALDMALLSSVALTLRDTVPRERRVKGSVSYPFAFTGSDVVGAIQAALLRDDAPASPFAALSRAGDAGAARRVALLLAKSLKQQLFFHEVDWDQGELRDGTQEVYMFLEDSLRGADEAGGGAARGGANQPPPLPQQQVRAAGSSTSLRQQSISSSASQPSPNHHHHHHHHPYHHQHQPPPPHHHHPHQPHEADDLEAELHYARQGIGLPPRVPPRRSNTADLQELPTGVFVPLTRCYSTLCARYPAAAAVADAPERAAPPRWMGCYSPTCPHLGARRLGSTASASAGAAAHHDAVAPALASSSSTTTSSVGQLSRSASNLGAALERSASSQSTAATSVAAAAAPPPPSSPSLAAAGAAKKRGGVQALAWAETVPASLLASLPRREVKRQNAIHEMAQKEEEFLADLACLEDVFLHRLERPSERGDPPPIPIGPERDAFVAEVFSNHRELRSIVSDLVARLTARQRHESPVVRHVGDICLDACLGWGAAFDANMASCPLAKQRVQREAAVNPRFKSYLETCRSDPACRRLPMEHFLQRALTHLPRYRLHLSSILEATADEAEAAEAAAAASESDGDGDAAAAAKAQAAADVRAERESLARALEVVDEQCRQAQKSVAASQVRVRIREYAYNLASKRNKTAIDMDLLNPQRQLVHQGRVYRKPDFTEIEWVDLLAVLFDNYFVVTKTKRRGEDAGGGAGGAAGGGVGGGGMGDAGGGDGVGVGDDGAGVGSSKFYIVKRPIPVEMLELSGFNDVSVSRSLGLGNLHLRSGAESRDLWPFTVYHIGRMDPMTLFAPSQAAREEWRRKLDEAKGLRAAVQEANRVYDSHLLSDSAFALASAHSLEPERVPPGADASLFHGRVTCAVPFRTGGADSQRHLVAIGCADGVWIGLRHDARSVRKVLHLRHVTQCAVLEEHGLFVVLADRVLVAYSLEALVPRPGSNATPRPPQKLSGNRDVLFFAVGRIRDKTLLVYMKRRASESVFRALEPTFEPGDAVAAAGGGGGGGGQSSGSGGGKHEHGGARGLFGRLGGSQNRGDWFRVYRSFFIPSEAYAMQFLKSKLCIVCARGFEIMNLETLLPGTIPDFGQCARDDARVQSLVARVDKARPLAMYKLSEAEFLLCYDAFACYVDRLGEPIRLDSIIEWEGSPTSVAFQYPYVLAFDARFVEVRDATSGELVQVVRGSDVRHVSGGTGVSSEGDEAVVVCERRASRGVGSAAAPFDVQVVSELVLTAAAAREERRRRGGGEAATTTTAAAEAREGHIPTTTTTTTATTTTMLPPGVAVAPARGEAGANGGWL